ncbi:hypothetical protein [Albimonas pacifica]|uniref:hypothetical protein n=1 Tax=Albimonas pacifica TaxID=1114924 RepID=UPI000B8523D8|nr:hypothetical protein [Albimonas pacifica]
MTDITPDELAEMKGRMMALEVAFVALGAHLLRREDAAFQREVLRTISRPTVLFEARGPGDAEEERPRALAMRSFEKNLQNLSDPLQQTIGANPARR